MRERSYEVVVVVVDTHGWGLLEVLFEIIWRVVRFGVRLLLGTSERVRRYRGVKGRICPRSSEERSRNLGRYWNRMGFHWSTLVLYTIGSSYWWNAPFTHLCDTLRGQRSCMTFTNP